MRLEGIGGFPGFVNKPQALQQCGQQIKTKRVRAVRQRFLRLVMDFYKNTGQPNRPCG